MQASGVSPATGSHAATDGTAADYAADRARVEDTVGRFVLALDGRDIDDAVACLAPRVRWDYSSVTGQPATEFDAGALAQRWKSSIVHTDASQHFLSVPHIQVSGERAVCKVHAQVTVRLANRTGSHHQTTFGTYTFELDRGADGWRIASVKMLLLWNEGNPRIMELAVEKGARQ